MRGCRRACSGAAGGGARPGQGVVEQADKAADVIPAMVEDAITEKKMGDLTCSGSKHLYVTRRNNR